MNCNCLNDIKERFDDKLKNELPRHLGYNSNFDGEHLSLEFKKQLGIKFQYRYRRIKNNNEPEKRITSKESFLIASFCPFCGAKV